jgi:hypothetical protein
MQNRFLNPLPGVPSVESPFFEKIFADLELDARTMQVALDLRSKGYAVIDFPDPDLFQMAEEIKENLHSRCDWQARSEGRMADLRIADAWSIDRNVHRIASNPRIIELLTTLYGRKAFPFQTLTFPVGTQQHVHTDSVHFSSSPERFMCGVWVALEDIDENNGPLIYYPGTHSWPIYTNEHIGINAADLTHIYGEHERYEVLWRALIERSQIKPERFLAQKGRALIWAANLLHGGDKQNDMTRTRWSQVTHYYFDSCAYYTPFGSDAFFGRILFREPTDISTGTQRKSVVGGHAVPQEFISATRTKFS